jgi:hypothetical protein
MNRSGRGNARQVRTDVCAEIGGSLDFDVQIAVDFADDFDCVVERQMAVLCE